MRAYLKREVARIVQRCRDTLAGIAVAWREEASFAQWTAANVVSAGLACAIEMSAAERGLIIGFGLLVLVTELLNTGIEAAIDRTSTERHPLAKKAKDAACAAVTLSALTTGIMWLIVLVG